MLEFSYASGPTDEPLIQSTIGEQISAVAAYSPNEVAVQTDCARLTYRQLDEQSDALALYFSNLGLKAPERVVVCLGNLAEYIVIMYACAKLGLITVPVNSSYTDLQLLGALKHISASYLILSTQICPPFKKPISTFERFQAILDGQMREGIPVKEIMLINNSNKVIQDETEPFPHTAVWYHKALEQHLGQIFNQPTLKSTDTINIQFTSGTTSAPKAACLTHMNILNNAYLVGRNLKLTKEDKICCAPPLFHCFGIVLGVLAALTHGCTIIIPSETFSPRAVLEALVRYEATVLYGVPTMFLAELEEISQSTLYQQGFPKLRTGLIGGSVIAPSLRKKIHEDLNLPSLLNIYGMTESSPVCCMTRLEHEDETHFYTVGSVMPHTELRVVSMDDPYQVLPKGSRGELLISGFLVMKGYWEDEKKTSEALITDSTSESNCAHQTPKVWLRTGDEALMQVDGTIKITGRIKDTIIRAGENIYPSEIENILLQQDSVSSIAVVGLSDDYYGELVAAFIVPHPQTNILMTDDKLTVDLRENLGSFNGNGHESSPARTMTSGVVRELVRERLSKNCVPKYVFWLSQLPLTASGKIEKYKLREMGERWLEFKINSPLNSPINGSINYLTSGTLSA